MNCDILTPHDFFYHGQHAAIRLHVQGLMPKNWRGFIDKTEARLAQDRLQLYSEFLYSSTVIVYIHRCICVCNAFMIMLFLIKGIDVM